MMDLTGDRLRQIALEAGAAVVGIGSGDRLLDAPPSGDPGYLLPSAQSVISFAIPFDRDALRSYFSKSRWRVFGRNQKAIQIRLYAISDALVSFLTQEGHEALGVAGNCTYRPEEGAGHFTQMTRFVPDFSHQYGAVAAGLGRLGWSGNLLIPGIGAAVLLGTVLTSARLRPDPVAAENPCDRCGLCTLVCPVAMMDRQKSCSSRIAGIREEIGRRQPHSCCWIGCGDYHGLSPDGSWSNWSPYRIEGPLPPGKDGLDAKMIQLRSADPESDVHPNPYTDHRAVTFDPDWNFTAVCGNCANICWADREDREINRRMVVETGVVVLNADGTRQATREEIVEVETPYGVNVGVSLSEYRKIKTRAGKNVPFEGSLPKDRLVLEHLYRTA